MNEKESARMTSDRSPVLQTLIQFYEYALSRRDVKRAAELLTEDVFFVGTAESIADRQNFERSFRKSSAIYRTGRYMRFPITGKKREGRIRGTVPVRSI